MRDSWCFTRLQSVHAPERTSVRMSDVCRERQACPPPRSRNCFASRLGSLLAQYDEERAAKDTRHVAQCGCPGQASRGRSLTATSSQGSKKVATRTRVRFPRPRSRNRVATAALRPSQSCPPTPVCRSGPESEGSRRDRGCGYGLWVTRSGREGVGSVLREGVVSTLARPDDVVEEADTEDLAGVAEPLGHVVIFAAWSWISGRMIVQNQQSHRTR